MAKAQRLEELVAKMWATEDTVDVLFGLIKTAAAKEERDDSITARDLKQNEVPAKRDTKGTASNVSWRGMSGPSNWVAASYQSAEQAAEVNQRAAASRRGRPGKWSKGYEPGGNNRGGRAV